jgi:hypothetical protein
MSRLKGFTLFRLILVISLFLVSLTTLPSKGYCDDWVKISSNKLATDYYQPSSVKINKQKKTIEVWSKSVYTEEGKIDFLDIFDSSGRRKFRDINYSLYLTLVDYNKRKVWISKSIDYSKSGNVLSDKEHPPKWDSTIPDNWSGNLLDKLIQDYNIQK